MAEKTGILDCLGRCENTAGNTMTTFTNKVTVSLKHGFLVVCGRLVECEEGTEIIVNTPTSGSISGKIILRIDLSSTRENEFVFTLKDGELVQEDLNNKINGIASTHKFELLWLTAR